jgi:cytochrome c oxidase subunit 2
VYEGACKEFCGLSHAKMEFRVVAHTPEDFARWLDDWAAPPPRPEADSDAAAGLQEFLEQRPKGTCTNCHAIDGLRDENGEPVPGSNSGPNLSHFASRTCFAGCTLETNDENLRRWLDDPPALKAGSWMPDYDLTAGEIDSLIAFLNSLT